MKVNGKVLVVTGAGNGMGREVSLELLRRGAKEPIEDTFKICASGRVSSPGKKALIMLSGPKKLTLITRSMCSKSSSFIFTNG